MIRKPKFFAPLKRYTYGRGQGVPKKVIRRKKGGDALQGIFAFAPIWVSRYGLDDRFRIPKCYLVN